MSNEEEASPEDQAPSWNGERHSIAVDYEGIFQKVADTAQIPPVEGIKWCAAIVKIVGRDTTRRDGTGETVSYLHYLQDTDWKASERDVLRFMIRQVRARIGI